MQTLREVGRGFFCARDKDLLRPSAQTARYLSFPQPILLAEPAQTRYVSDPESTTWKEGIYLLLSK